MAEKSNLKKTGRVKDAVKAVRARSSRTAKSLNRVKLLVSIVNTGDGQNIVDVINDFSISLNYTVQGTGTARSSVLDYLGIGTTEKEVIFAVIPENDEEAILREIRTKMSLYLVGKGISFTLPLSAVSEIVANGLLGAAANKTADGSKIMKNTERKYDLIVAAIAANNVDEAMESARSAGAVGGTVLRARSLGNTKAEQFIGISLQTEQEILLILSKREQKAAIMQALSESVGLKTESGGVLFSLPVDNTVGIGAAGETDTKEEVNG